jgi:hypothetical protein
MQQERKGYEIKRRTCSGRGKDMKEKEEHTVGEEKV